MPPVAIAVGAAGLLGAGASIVAGSQNAKAINKSTDANLEAQREAIAAQTATVDKQIAASTDALNKQLGYSTDTFNSSGQLQTDVRNQNINILNPLAQTGYSAMNKINSLVGLPQQAAYTPTPITFTPVTAPTTTPTPTPTPAPGSAPLTSNVLIPAYAKGTPPWGHPGGPALVGENGPEVVNLPAGSSVIPNNVLQRHGWGSGNVFSNDNPAAHPTPTPTPTATTSATSVLSPQDQALNSFYNTQFYQFPLQQGLNALNSSYAARGLLQSGAAQKSLEQYASGVASGAFGDYLQVLGNQQSLGANAASAETGIGSNYANGLSGLGQNLAGNISNAYGNYGNALSNAYGNLGNAQAGYAQNVGNINSNSVLAHAGNTGQVISGVGNALGSAAGYFAYQPMWGTAANSNSSAPAGFWDALGS